MNSPTTVDWPTSALQAADAVWIALTCDPDPLALDCTMFDADIGLPARVMPLPELRRWLLAHRNYPARDVVWRELATRARTADPKWVIACVGMAMPALVRMAGSLAAGYRGDPADLDAEILTGFLRSLRGRQDLAESGLYAKLCWAGWRAGHNARLAEHRYLPVDNIDTAASRLPQRPYGHPDLLVARAQSLRILDADEAELFTAVRLAHQPIERIAARQGKMVDLLRRRLERAETRLADALTAGHLSGPVSQRVVAELATRASLREKVRAARVIAASPCRR